MMVMAVVRLSRRPFMADTVVMPDPERATLVLVTGGHGSGKVIPTAFMVDTVVMPDPEEVVVCERNAIAVTTYGGHGSGKVNPTAYMADTVVTPDPE
ncbi:hypothetical protein RCL_jg6315.t1 [Rhizophagus clarus]|uniref:Uncharacterized protein n=1 Tax=Rhizophagus clarus TaxID=94130 RepID=A0A8H3QJW6_9GLOM|nr:hypothetical protein RCL_jg6315.t1 [Rhizophagus clarus]